jgi:exonuclease VII large subunit
LITHRHTAGPHLGTWCDISSKPHLDGRAYAQKVVVWSAADSQQNIDVINARITRKDTAQTTERQNAVTALTTSIQNARNDLNASIRQERQHTDEVRDQIRQSLREELQRLLRAQTCEDQVVPDEGTPGRAARVTAKLDCIRTGLNNWRGVNAEGQRIVVADGNALSREQVTQMIRSLELLLLDADVTPAQRQFIVDTMDQFVFFNLM